MNCHVGLSGTIVTDPSVVAVTRIGVGTHLELGKHTRLKWVRAENCEQYRRIVTHPVSRTVQRHVVSRTFGPVYVWFDIRARFVHANLVGSAPGAIANESEVGKVGSRNIADCYSINRRIETDLRLDARRRHQGREATCTYLHSYCRPAIENSILKYSWSMPATTG